VNTRRIAAYYSAVTANYTAYAGEARGWHWGIWERDVKTHQQALIRENELLVRGLDVSSRTRVLDVGCGVGGFAVWAAKTFGCRVTGITICADHVPLARRYARKRGVERLCEFLQMDMERLRFRDSRFDVVLNQESFCYSLNKGRYLSSVFDVLAPGGTWCCIDTYLAPRQPTADFRRLRNAVYEGFQIPSFPSVKELERHLRTVGFVDVETVDVTKNVLPNQDRMKAAGLLPFALAALFPQWCFSGTPAEIKYRSGHYRAGAAFLMGLGLGYFKHVLHRARRPRTPLREASARRIAATA
jgi:cyclopropane fatty-acyl-phospholipid synthase-like methyltransferase